MYRYEAGIQGMLSPNPQLPSTVARPMTPPRPPRPGDGPVATWSPGSLSVPSRPCGLCEGCAAGAWVATSGT